MDFLLKSDIFISCNHSITVFLKFQSADPLWQAFRYRSSAMRVAMGTDGTHTEWTVHWFPYSTLPASWAGAAGAACRRSETACASIYPDSTMPGICTRMGLTDDCEETGWDALFYTVMRDAAPERAEKERKGQMCYTVEADDILPLGVKTVFHGQELYIGKIYRHLRKGILVSEYTLYFREGMESPRYNNPLLCGVSQYGTVTEVKRNQIRAALENDALIFCDDQYFYPYSTVAASPDGSGWYCMPKPGDPVRIFFPSEDEREGYAISNIEGESAPGQDSPISNPDLKDIIMPDGKGVKFIEGGIEVCVGDFLGDITLTDDGKVQMKVKEEKDIRIYSEGMVYFMTEEGGTIEASAGTQIQIKNDAGGEICMTDDTVRIEASSIENN